MKPKETAMHAKAKDSDSSLLYSPRFQSEEGHRLRFKYKGKLELESLVLQKSNNNSTVWAGHSGRWSRIWSDVSKRFNKFENFEGRWFEAIVELPPRAFALRFRGRGASAVSEILGEGHEEVSENGWSRGRSLNSADSAWAAWVQVHFDYGPSERRWHTAVLDEVGNMWIFAGNDKDGHLLNDLWYFNTLEVEGGAAWGEVSSHSLWPSPRFSHMAVMEGQRMWVFGGVVAGGLSKELWNYDCGESGWTFLEASGPSARESMTMVNEGGRLWMFGGYDGTKRNDLWYFEALAASKASNVKPSWTLVEPNGPVPPARYSHVAVQESGRMWIFGGLAETLLKDFWYFNTSSFTWTPVSGHGPSARESATAVTNGTAMWMFGGIEATNQNDELWLLDLHDLGPSTTASWHQIHSVGPNGHNYHVSVLDSRGRMWCHNGELWYFDTKPFTSTQSTSSTISSTISSTSTVSATISTTSSTFSSSTTSSSSSRSSSSTRSLP